MASVFLGRTIKELRARKKLTQESLIEMFAGFADYEPTVFRLETGELLPRPDTVRGVLDTLEAPMGDFLCPHLGNQPMDVQALRVGLIQALDNNDLPEAQALYDEMSALEGFDEPINRQFLLSQQARLWEQQGKPADEIMPLVREGLMETLEDLDENSPGDIVLVFEEPELFHTLARLHAAKGSYQVAAKILTDTINGLRRLPTGERERDRRVVPLSLSLIDCLLKSGAYEDALKACEFGFDVSVRQTAGQGVPEFILYKAQALHNMGQGQETANLLRMAFVGYMLLDEKVAAMDVLVKAKDECGVSFNTYGMENLDIPPRTKTPFARGKVPACKNIGEMIRILRKEAKLSLAELCEGICSVPNLSKIEMGDIHGHMHYIEPLLQRLGRDPLLYCNFFLTRADYEARELRDIVDSMLFSRKYDKAAAALEQLKTYEAYESRANLQFVKRAETELFMNEHGITHPEVEVKLLQTIRMSRSGFKEEDIRRYPLTLDEANLINWLASYSMETKELKRASKIYEALIENINRRYVDEREKVRIYSMFMFNYSTCLGRMERRPEALEVIKEAEDFDRNRGRLCTLPLLTYNKSYSSYMRGEREQSLPYLAMAYYGFAMFKDYGFVESLGIAQRTAMRFFGFEFD